MERQKSNKKDKELLTVSFYCAPERIFETKDILEVLDITGISSDYSYSSRQVVAGSTVFVQKGVLFSGVISGAEYPNLINYLAAKKIAGYSRETQIINTNPLDNS